MESYNKRLDPDFGMAKGTVCLDNECLRLKKFVEEDDDEGEEEDGQEEHDPGVEAPELIEWTCKKGHEWRTYGEVAFMTFVDPLSAEEITTGPICVKCYFKNLQDYYGAEKKENNHGFRP